MALDVKVKKEKFYQTGDSEGIKTSLIEFKGKQYIDIRFVFMKDDGTWQPTKKGVWVPLESDYSDISEFVDNLQNLLPEDVS